MSKACLCWIYLGLWPKCWSKLCLHWRETLSSNWSVADKAMWSWILSAYCCNWTCEMHSLRGAISMCGCITLLIFLALSLPSVKHANVLCLPVPLRIQLAHLTMTSALGYWRQEYFMAGLNSPSQFDLLWGFKEPVSAQNMTHQPLSYLFLWFLNTWVAWTSDTLCFVVLHGRIFLTLGNSQ